MKFVSKTEYEGWQAQAASDLAAIEDLQGELRQVREAAQAQYELLEETTRAIGIEIGRSEAAEAAYSLAEDEIKDLESELKQVTVERDVARDDKVVLTEIATAAQARARAVEEALSQALDAKDHADSYAREQAGIAERAEEALEDREMLIKWPELSNEDKQVLASKWADAACVHCGGYHIGVCNRIKRVELDEVGRKSLVLYRDTWEANPGTIWPDQVWSSFSERASAAEDAATRELETNAMKMLVERELHKANAEQRRPRSPVEVVKEILGA